VALSVDDPAATPLRVYDPVLCPAAIVTAEGDTPTSFADELTSVTVTPPGPAGVPKLMVPLSVLPTFIEELGSENVIAGKVTLNAVLVDEMTPGLVAVRVRPLPAVVMLRLGKVAIP
jgi:hypothetical protein